MQRQHFHVLLGFLGVLVQRVPVGHVVKRLGPRRTLAIGLASAAIGWGGSALTHSLPVFVLMLVPGALGIGLCNATLSTLISNAAGPHEQAVQGAAGALESLGRTIGPVWGNGALQMFGEGKAYGSAAIALLGAALLTTYYHRPAETAERGPDRPSQIRQFLLEPRDQIVELSTTARTVSGWLRSTPAFCSSSIGWSLPPARSSVR